MDRTLKHLLVPISDLRPYPGNPRRGDVEAIRASLERHGQFRSLVVNRRTNEVLAGNHILAAAQGLGWPELAVSYVDVDADQARRIVLADNRTSDLAGYDEGALAELLQELPDLDGTGYDSAALGELLDAVAPVELPGEDEAVPPAPERPRTRPGDLYR